jgi:hypothetical protein
LGCLDPDPLTQLISDLIRIRIRAGFISLQEDHLALQCNGSSTGKTRIVGSRFDFRTGSDLKSSGHTQIWSKS